MAVPFALRFAPGASRIEGRGCLISCWPVVKNGGSTDFTGASFAAFVDAVRNKKTPVSGVYNGRDAVLVGLLVRTAVDLKRTVTMKEILAQG